MEKKRLLQIDRQKIRKHWGKTEREVEEYISMLKEWIEIKKFPEIPTDHMIEFFLTNCKYDIEKTKTNIETYYSIRKSVPEIYESSNPRNPQIQESWNFGCYCPLPKPIDGLYRLSFISLNPDILNFNIRNYFANFMNVYEIRILEDLVLSEIIVLDYKHLKLSQIFHFSPFLVTKMVRLLENVAKSRVKQLHFINSPSYLSILLNLGKKIMKKKMMDRILVHKSLESLYEYIPREMLPMDYGGKERPLNDFIEMWKKKIEAHQDRFDKLDEMAQ